MALWDTAYCLAAAKRDLNRPTVDAALDDDTWYQYMTEAQAYWIGQIAAHAPQFNQTIEQAATADSMVYTITYQPLGHATVKSSRRGRVLIPGPDWDNTADITWEGAQFRIPGGRTRVFADGPWVFYTPQPTVTIDGTGSNILILKPENARSLIVQRMCIMAAIRLKQDPEPFRARENELWQGMPGSPDYGILGALKTAYYADGASGGYNGRWWDGIGG